MTSTFYNAFGVYITKHASAAQSCTIDISRTSIVWVYFLLVPVYDNPTETFYAMQLFGFVLITIGTLYFNKIFEMPMVDYTEAHHHSILMHMSHHSVAADGPIKQ